MRHISAVSEIISSLSLFCFCFCFLGDSVFVRKFPQTSTYQRSLKDNILSLFILFLYFFSGFVFVRKFPQTSTYQRSLRDNILSFILFLFFFFGFCFCQKITANLDGYAYLSICTEHQSPVYSCFSFVSSLFLHTIPSYTVHTIVSSYRRIFVP